ncbi:FAD-dependent oxidoreductase [Acaryochloris marina]|uniref:FAD-binding domain-containing protein n=1 Tax=Acaryochloris marina (strain MBIC 11017) TaxID=329726 RepID=B0C034_ACAM1|nr:NAD(P)/FAD-dependent oxidoreductase [Acaryochloris marina]ABW28381.1 hypothetical protein AM1_3387 [Acaryochloris marina MBIC11017]
MVNSPSEKPLSSEKNRTAVVVGGGPTGTLIALYLAQAGWHVSVYEQRSADAKASSNRRSFNIVLNRRGLKALEDAGVQLPPDKQVCITGNIRHTEKDSILRKGFRTSVSVDRHTLAQSLIAEGKNRFPDNIQYYFEQTLLQLNLHDKTALFQEASGQHEQTFDLLIGADGISSTVRYSMSSQLEGFTVRQHADDMMYKICNLGLAEHLPGATAEWADAFHVWPGAEPVTMAAPPSADGVIRAVLILPQEGEITFDTIRTEADVSALFKAKLPVVFPNLDQTGFPSHFVQDLLSQKAAHGGFTTMCNRFEDGDCVVLLGDAAHSIWPSLGQGCNVALESCRIFAEVLAHAQGDLSLALPAYTAARKPDTDAVARLSEIGFGGNKRASNPLFKAKVSTLILMHKLLPKWFKGYALLQIGNADVPYANIWQQAQSQEKQLLGLFAIVVGIVPMLWITFQIIHKVWL